MGSEKKIKFKNITVSGLPGAGSSLLAQALAKKLKMEYFSGGDFMRAYAIKHKLFDKNNSIHHTAVVYDDKFDHKVDYMMRDWLKKDSGKVIESWLAGFVAQGIKDAFKVLIYCSKDDIRVDRLVNRDGISIAKAKRHIFLRQEENLRKWTRMYQKEWSRWVDKDKQKHRLGNYLNFYHPSLYDLAIDTYSHDREQTFNMVLEKLGFK